MEQRNTHYEKKVLLIFVKNPRQGKVKTRLAKTIGEARALEIYRELLAITKSAADPLEVARQVWYSDYIDEDDLWPGEAYEKRLQEGESLGMRMQEAFRQAFAAGFERAVIIGSDCPGLSAGLLRRAYDLLKETSVVIGPSQDGGYYLLGMSEYYPRLFEQKEWSTASVCAQTQRQLRKKNIPWRMLPELNDIDTEADLQQSCLSL